MKVGLFLVAVLIALSTLVFGVSNFVNAAEIKTSQVREDNRVEFVWINGVLWIIIYDADGNIVQASAIGHSERTQIN